MVSKEIQQSLMRIGGVALASVLLASCSQDWSSEKQAFSDTDNNPYAKGKAQMAGGRYGLAIESFRKALQSDPGSVKALNGLAAAYDLLGRFDLAERYYRLALNFDPSSIQSLNNLGYSYYLRGEYKKARGLFERAARVDAKNAIVAANMAALDKADMSRQVAEARTKSGGKGEKKATPTTWIERSDMQVQSMVTKPDPETVAAARKNNVEPRIVHTPKPLIEIATADPVRIRSTKPEPSPAASGLSVAVASPEASPITVVGRAPETAAASHDTAMRKTPIALLATRQQPAKLEKVEPEFVDTAKPTTTSTNAPKLDTFALVATPDEPAPDTPQATMKGTAELPKLNRDIAHDVRDGRTGTKTAALGEAPVLLAEDPTSDSGAPVLKKAKADVADRPQQLAAVPADSEPVLPAAPQAVAATAEPALVETPSEKAAGQASRKAPEKAPKPGAEQSALPAPRTATSADRPVQMAAVGDTREPAMKESGKGKLATEEASEALAALAKSLRIEISNGAGRLNMAHRMREYLNGHGGPKMRLTNAISFTNQVSVLYYRPGHIANAKSLVSLLPVAPELRPNEKISTDLRLVLGGDLLEFDRDLIDRFK